MLFSTWANDPLITTLPPDIRQLVYQVAIREGDGSQFDFLLSQLPMASLQETKKVIYGLGASQMEEKLLTLLDFTIDPAEPIGGQDAVSVYDAVGQSAIGSQVQFQWLQDR